MHAPGSVPSCPPAQPSPTFTAPLRLCYPRTPAPPPADTPSPASPSWSPFPALPTAPPNHLRKPAARVPWLPSSLASRNGNRPVGCLLGAAGVYRPRLCGCGPEGAPTTCQTPCWLGRTRLPCWARLSPAPGPLGLFLCETGGREGRGPGLSVDPRLAFYIKHIPMLPC